MVMWFCRKKGKIVWEEFSKKQELGERETLTASIPSQSCGLGRDAGGNSEN